ncbi:MAG: hypothetical protein WCF01_10880, partial [Nitrososphaeraceae archaeon]
VYVKYKLNEFDLGRLTSSFPPSVFSCGLERSLSVESLFGYSFGIIILLNSTIDNMIYLY